MKEIFKDIKDYEGLYQVSNLGRVRSLKYGKEKILKANEQTYGYMNVKLCKNGVATNTLIHRLVAEAFIPNPDNLSEVNHKDEDKSNNRVDNLEWCNEKYNLNYGTRLKRMSKKILQLTKDGELVKEWASIAEASHNGFNKGNIAACLKGKLITTGGFKWIYA